MLKLPDGNSSVLVQGQRRMKVVEFVQLEPLMHGEARYRCRTGGRRLRAGGA